MTSFANAAILIEVAKYCTTKLAEYGETLRDFDWNGEECKVPCLVQVCKIIDKQNQFSINNLDCGCGALYAFLADKYETLFHCSIKREVT